MENSKGSTSISMNDLPASPTKAVDSSKKRTLKFTVNRTTGKNKSSEVSASPIRKSPPLLTSTPKPSPKNPQLLPSLSSDFHVRNVNAPILKKTPVVVLDRTAVSDYLAKKNVPAVNGVNLDKDIVPKSSKKPGPAKPTAEKKPARTVRNPRPSKVKPKKAALTTTPPTEVEVTTTEEISLGVIANTIMNVHQEIGSQAGISTTRVQTTEEINVDFATNTETNSHQEVAPCDAITTKIPSEILVTFGITSHHQGLSDSPTSTITEPLSPKASENTSVPENEHNQISVSTQEENPSIFGIESIGSMDIVPHVTSIVVTNRTPASRSVAAASNCVMDVLDSGSCSENEEHLPVTSHCDFHFELNRRLYDLPRIVQLDDLCLGSKDVRRVAPYSLKIADDEERFFVYAAVLAKSEEKYCCLLFGIIDQYMVTYGGHFIVCKERIYSPVLKTPVAHVKTTDLADYRDHLCLFNIPNERLLRYDGYFRSSRNASLDMLHYKFIDMYLHSLNQVMLKERIRSETIRNETVNSINSASSGARFPVTCTIEEPRTQQLFYDTSLPITQERMDRILNFVQPMGTIKKRFAELAVMQASCALQPKFHSAHYVAHEDSGCAAFYPTAYVLGSTSDHYVVGVIVDETFFIMATKRLFNRTDALAVGLHPVVPCAELFENIILPLHLSHEHALVMLEVRQILKHQEKHRELFKELNQALGISGFRSSSLTNSFFDITTATQPKSERLHNAWLEQTLDGHFNSSVSDAPCKFPTHPACPANPLIFCENMLKLWMQRLLREVHDIAECDVSNRAGPSVLSEHEFFKLSPTSFVAFFLPIFGLMEEHSFQCLILDSHGEPSGVCQEKISASSVGHHVENCHIRPLLWDDSTPTRETIFSTFTLVFRKRDNPPLLETCDFNLLKWARSMEEKWHPRSHGSYIRFLETLSRNQKLPNNIAEKAQQITSAEKPRERKKNSPGQVSSNKRKRTIDEVVVEEELKRRCLSQEVSEPSD